MTLAAARNAPAADTVLRLSLLLLLLHGPPGQSIGVRILCVAMLAVPGFLRQSYLWWGLLCFVLVANGRQWYIIDNHQFLITYWTGVCALAMGLEGARSRAEFLRCQARALIAIVFVFAAGWKLLGGQYLDGSFMYLTFVMDARFQQVTSFVTGLPVDELRAATEAAQYVAISGTPERAILLPESARLRLFTLFLSWAGIAGEAAIGLLHMGPAKRYYVLQHNLLWGFVAVTYFLFPVLGFAFILTILGSAGCMENDRNRRASYLLLVLIIHLTRLPWQNLLRLVG